MRLLEFPLVQICWLCTKKDRLRFCFVCAWWQHPPTCVTSGQAGRKGQVPLLPQRRDVQPCTGALPQASAHPTRHENLQLVVVFALSIRFQQPGGLPSSPQEASLREWQAFSYSTGVCVPSLALTSKPSFRPRSGRSPYSTGWLQRGSARRVLVVVFFRSENIFISPSFIMFLLSRALL